MTRLPPHWMWLLSEREALGHLAVVLGAVLKDPETREQWTASAWVKVAHEDWLTSKAYPKG